MENKRKPRRAEKPCQVSWVHSPDPTAEAEFWRLYLKLALEAMVEGQNAPKEARDDHQA